MAKLNATLFDGYKERLNFLKRYPYILLLISYKNWYFGRLLQWLYSDEEYIARLYKKAFKRDLNLIDPKTFNEKLQWLKLNYRDPAMAICADKYAVRGYLKNMGFGYLLNEVLAVYDNAEDIDFSKLPERFVLKASHGSGWNILCENKAEYSWSAWRKVMDSWLHQNLYVYGREWVYKEMKPRIICEKYLDVTVGELFDYKFFCLNGKVEFIQATDNDKKSARINLYDSGWNLMKEKYAYMGSPKNIPRPVKLEHMLEIAEKLSDPFPFARIDLYDVNGDIIFGEITFFPSSGFKGFDPEEFDFVLGRRLLLPEANI